MSLRETLQCRWDANRRPPWWTLPIAALYRTVTAARHALYRRRWLPSDRLPVPVIVVGNLTVGGTGKTPLVIALVEALRARGYKPGVVSRGYGGCARTPMLLDENPDPRVTGDEPALIRIRVRAPVAIGRRRAAAARLLLDTGIDVVIADDGLQHNALARDIEICVVDGERRFGNGRLLPAGPLREPLSRLNAVDFVVCNGGAAKAGEVVMSLHAERAVSLRDPASTRALESFASARVHAVAGIGHPARFFAALRAHGVAAIEHAFPDHHAYRASDLDFGEGVAVLMTEKDAIKCRAFARENWWSVPADALLPPSFFDAIVARLVRRA
ncbi:MAG TPA: tetraacyldisaccharide 4'-kinase [Rhodanobacteraceae bacterium]|nr:tetraacyldisaccharide 4'-kinase [Rhodanobacteraceae bacterium]